MAASNVQSIESLQRLRQTLVTLSSDWRGALQQVRFTVQRIEEDFTSQWPAYWKRQNAIAEMALQEALDNLSRLQSTRAGASDPATEAKQRVNAARRRLALCQSKQALAKQLALAIGKACQDLAGPAAEVRSHAEVQLPKAAIELAALIDHLSRYAEIQSDPQANDPS